MNNASYTRTLSFTYSGDRTRAIYLNFFASLVARYGLSRCSVTSRIMGLSREEVITMSMSYWSTSDNEKLQRANLLPWPEEKIQAFTRSIKIDSYTYTNDDETLGVAVDAASDNIYPVLGVWTWLGTDLDFQGGFVEMQARDKSILPQMASEIIEYGNRGTDNQSEEASRLQRLAQELGLGYFSPQG